MRHPSVHCDWYCAFLATGHVGGYIRNVNLQKLVTKPIVFFAKLLCKDGALSTHDNNKYHKDALVATTHFLKITNASEKCVSNQIDK